MRTIAILLVLSLVGICTSCKKKEPKLITTQQVEVVEVAKPEPVEEKKEEPKPIIKQANYYLVAGCFKVRENAERLNAKLLNQGYNSKILPFYNMSMVTYEGYETRQEAQDALNRIVREDGKEETWVYPVK